VSGVQRASGMLESAGRTRKVTPGKALTSRFAARSACSRSPFP